MAVTSKTPRQAHRERMEALWAEAIRIVATGICPDCGSGLRRNTSLRGWWQCEQYGSPQFRARPDAPACSFQTFTEG